MQKINLTNNDTINEKYTQMKDDFESKLTDQMERLEELNKKLDEIEDEGSYDDEEEDEESD